MREIISYYSLRWYYLPILFTLIILNRVIQRSYPLLSLSAVDRKDISLAAIILETLLKGSFIGLLIFFLPGTHPIPLGEKLSRSLTLGLIIWYIFFPGS